MSNYPKESAVCMECQCRRCGNQCCEDWKCYNGQEEYGCTLPNTKCEDFIVPNQYRK